MKISFVDTDPRALTDPLYKTNMGSFSIVAHGFNLGLKNIGCYAEPDDADFVGICDALNIGFKYKNKPSFIVNVWDTINALPEFLVQNARNLDTRILGLSDQITQLWRKYGVECETAMPGCSYKFWTPVVEKQEREETIFLFNSFANVRSGLDLAVEAFSRAFTKKDNAILIIKNTESNPTLEKYLSESLKNCKFHYITGRSSFYDMRELYRLSDYSLNVMRMSSYGLGIHEALACGCIPIVGNFNPSNRIVKGLSSFLINPTAEINIKDKLPELIGKGLHNAYGNFKYIEEPRFYDYSIDEYAKLLRHLHEYKVRCNVELERDKLGVSWSWEGAAENLVKQLNE
jgi:hypothetical protein